jgi:hypothetical protein
MAEDTSSVPSSDAFLFPTLTILYLPADASEVIEEIGQKYCNMTTEDISYYRGYQQRT